QTRHYPPCVNPRDANAEPVLSYRTMTRHLKFRLATLALAALFCAAVGATTATAAPPAGVGQMFRLDGGNVTYVFGVNDRAELQPLYWGGKLAQSAKFPPARSLPEMASFDPPMTTTPQEYAAWGAGLYTEPALKITFADGNRDLVLHYVSSKSTGTSY